MGERKKRKKWRSVSYGRYTGPRDGVMELSDVQMEHMPVSGECAADSKHAETLRIVMQQLDNVINTHVHRGLTVQRTTPTQ